MNSQWGDKNLPRYWITLGKEIIRDYPKDFKNKTMADARSCLEDSRINRFLLRDLYPHSREAPTVSDVIREYIETPKEELLTKSFEHDRWGLTDILRAADRRIGKRRLLALKLLHNTAVTKIIDARLKSTGSRE
jgi:hypothetical protein